VFHFVADYHGRGDDGNFVFDLIREAHLAFVEAKMRDQVTLIGSGGVVAAEHVPKAIIAGLDLVTLDTPLLVAIQAEFEGECRDRTKYNFTLPQNLNREWGIQRILNMTAAWRDQLLEILGAMGLREVRRLRGEMGRAMFQVDLEHEAFAEIEGYE
jgi:glutamate synthase domain-containing protein 2